MYEDDEDEFGDFEEFGDFAEPSGSSGSVGEAEENENSDRKEPPEDQAVPEEDSSDWAADFTEFSSSSSAPIEENEAKAPASCPPSSYTEPMPTLDELLEEEDFWLLETTVAEGDEDSCGSGVFDILSDFDAGEISKDERSSLRLWGDLRIVEEALALKFQWRQSATNAVLLDILKMDVKKAEIKSSYLPAFAQQLAGGGAVLKPTPHGASSPQDAPQKPQDGIKPVTSLAVEPVNFNWSESGMQNPLTGSSVSAASEMLDFDFFVANEQKESSDGSVLPAALQRDLDELGLTTTEDVSKVPATTQQSSSWNVDELLKKQQATRQGSPSEMTNGKLVQSRSRNELSLDAQALHDSLPDLDYMLSNVLMFVPTSKTSR